MQKITIALLLLFIVSCKQVAVNEDRLSRLAIELIETDFTQSYTPEASDIVIISDALKNQLIDIQKNSSEYSYAILKDYAQNEAIKADAAIRIITNYKDIAIRLKYDATKDKYEVIGWEMMEKSFVAK